MGTNDDADRCVPCGDTGWLDPISDTSDYRRCPACDNRHHKPKPGSVVISSTDDSGQNYLAYGGLHIENWREAVAAVRIAAHTALYVSNEVPIYRTVPGGRVVVKVADRFHPQGYEVSADGTFYYDPTLGGWLIPSMTGPQRLEAWLLAQEGTDECQDQ